MSLAFGGDASVGFAADAGVSIDPPLTAAVWVAPASTMFANEPFGDLFTRFNANTGAAWALSVASDGTLYTIVFTAFCAKCDGGNQSEPVRSAVVIAADVWTHVAATVDMAPDGGEHVQVYVNGVAESSYVTLPSDILGPPTPLQLGKNGSGVSGFSGRLSRAVLYQRALSVAEIQALADAGLLQ